MVLVVALGKPTIEVPDGTGEDFFAQADDPQGFFDNLPEQHSSETGLATANGAPGSEPATPMADSNHVTPENVEREDEIQKALFVGNYDAAVDACFKAGRLADALLIANMGGAELCKRTMHRYMRRNPRPYMQVGRCRWHTLL